MKYYSARDLANKYGMSYARAYMRFDSPFAKERWGVELLELPNGDKKLYVPENKLKLWERTKKWARPEGERWNINNRRKQILLRKKGNKFSK